jgi:CPA1 family monovalent cation:H+ antiporter
MTLFQILAILIALAAVFAYVNYRWIRLPMTIGVMMIALVVSLAIIIVGEVGYNELKAPAERILQRIDFNEAVLHGMLAFLLFAGALHIDLSDLARHRGVIALLATVGVIVSTFIVGGLTWWVLRLVDIELPMIACLIFGALISPTDPIAVLGIMRNVGAPKDLETEVAGESLFNDGIGVVVFLVLIELAGGAGELGVGGAAWLFVKEAVGGTVLGLSLGFVTYHMLKRVNNYQVEVLLTLALAMGVYALAEVLHMSAPIAVVVAGLLIGNHGRAFAMSPTTKEHVDTFWELIDEILNAVLFLLIGLEVLVMPLYRAYFVAALLAIPITLLARWASVSAVVLPMRRFRTFTPGAIPILTWGGLRGGISVALALSLTPEVVRDRNVILAITYAVVIFSIVVQGLTVGKLVKRFATREISTESPQLEPIV